MSKQNSLTQQMTPISGDMYNKRPYTSSSNKFFGKHQVLSQFQSQQKPNKKNINNKNFSLSIGNIVQINQNVDQKEFEEFKKQFLCKNNIKNYNDIQNKEDLDSFIQSEYQQQKLEKLNIIQKQFGAFKNNRTQSGNFITKSKFLSKPKNLNQIQTDNFSVKSTAYTNGSTNSKSAKSFFNASISSHDGQKFNQIRQNSFLNSIPDLKFNYKNEDVHHQIKKNSKILHQKQEPDRHVKMCNIIDHIQPNYDIIGDPLLEHFNKAQKMVPDNLDKLKQHLIDNLEKSLQLKKCVSDQPQNNFYIDIIGKKNSLISSESKNQMENSQFYKEKGRFYQNISPNAIQMYKMGSSLKFNIQSSSKIKTEESNVNLNQTQINEDELKEEDSTDRNLNENKIPNIEGIDTQEVQQYRIFLQLLENEMKKNEFEHIELQKLNSKEINQKIEDMIEREKLREKMLSQGNLDGDTSYKASLQIDQDQISRLANLMEMLNINFNKFAIEKKQIISEKEQFEKYLKASKQILSHEELYFIQEQFQFKQQGVDFIDIEWKKMDEILQNMVFFQKYGQQTRINLLKAADLVTYPSGSIIFKQGDIGNHMYVILKGSVNVIAKPPLGEFEKPFIVAVLYDGQHFGELSMMETYQKRNKDNMVMENINVKSLKFIKDQLQKYDKIIKFEEQSKIKGKSQEDIEKQVVQLKQQLFQPQSEEIQEDTLSKEQKQGTTKRAATIQCSDDCYMLRITKDLFQNVLMGLMQDELDIKIKLLTSINLFDRFQPFALIPLANVLKLEKYQINDLILQQDKEIDKFFIVQQGRLKVVRIAEVVRSSILSNYTYALKKKPAPFYAGKYEGNSGMVLKNKDDNQNQKQEIQELLSQQIQSQQELEEIDQFLIEHPLRNKDLENTIQIFDYEKKFHNVPDEFKYCKFHEYKKLTVGDYFGCRAITQIPLNNDFNGFKAKLSVIADTNDVQVYTLKKDQLQYLPPTLQKYFLQELSEVKEFDDIDLPKEARHINYWENIKDRLYEDHLKIQALSKRREHFKDY
ncbi:Cyclic nucleotide-binding protein [Pseudocohnilembus persalinus]|uniref:Cyclic nucleotide-binding protein n=1 Tax=Pseudocohnilembus persalinus TaxID=266149 RepID=A0A0V0R6L1_PSEPJ|nr:Cyclic nucleotide-binding protein [Pseudocohnilembus persalinus]|eukprot:KRX10115.1 Cyclic nucleotide-binding protein [Pseudocohnilembus persalinus]